MVVFEKVFTKRCSTEAEDIQSVQGVFEEVFVRRGRWRENCTDTLGLSSQSLDVIDISLPKVGDPICTNPNDSQDANSKSMLDQLLAEDKIANSLQITDEFVVKNGFYSEALEYDSLQDFLLERKVQSCPVNVDIVLCTESVNNETEASPKAEILNTASSYADIDVPSIMLRQQALDTASDYGDAGAPQADEPSLEESFLTGSIYGDVDRPCMMAVESSAVARMPGLVNATSVQDQGCNVPEDMLSSLRVRGLAIHQTLLSIEGSDPNVLEMARDGTDGLPWGLSASGMNALAMQIPLNQLLPPPRYEPLCDTSLRTIPPPPPPFEVAPTTAPVIRLAEAVPPPELGSEALPTIGSLLHHTKQCKPCTFFHTRGCENKQDCQFCHLCGPGEKKKRLRQQRASKREAQAHAVGNARSILAAYPEVPMGGPAYSGAEVVDESDMVVE